MLNKEGIFLNFKLAYLQNISPRLFQILQLVYCFFPLYSEETELKSILNLQCKLSNWDLKQWWMKTLMTFWKMNVCAKWNPYCFPHSKLLKILLHKWSFWKQQWLLQINDKSQTAAFSRNSSSCEKSMVLVIAYLFYSAELNITQWTLLVQERDSGKVWKVSQKSWRGLSSRDLPLSAALIGYSFGIMFCLKHTCLKYVSWGTPASRWDQGNPLNL